MKSIVEYVGHINPVFAGIFTGSGVQIVTGNVLAAVATAMMTGAAAYIGQQISKAIHEKLKSKKQKKDNG